MYCFWIGRYPLLDGENVSPLSYLSIYFPSVQEAVSHTFLFIKSFWFFVSLASAALPNLPHIDLVFSSILVSE